MIPIVPTANALASVAVKITDSGKQVGSNFSGYMENVMAGEHPDKSNLFGLPKDEAPSVFSTVTKVPVTISSQKEAEDVTTIATLLGQFVQHLQAAASDRKQGPGEWTFPVPDPELIQKIARDAGMNETQLTTLLEKMKNQDGRLNLVDFLDSFSRHFLTLQDEVPVTAPETDLPLLQIIMERLGVPVPEVSRVSEAAVRGDNTIDLQKILAGLKELPGLRITDLNTVEAAQLQDFLAGAGVSQQLQRALLPERLPVIEGLVKSGPPVTLTLDRLKGMLEQAVQDVKANRLQADPLAFLADLQEMLTRSGFEVKGPSLSSAVQGTLVAVFEKLMESVDLSKVKVQKVVAPDAGQEMKSQPSQNLYAAQDNDSALLFDGDSAEPMQPATDREGRFLTDGKNGPASGELFSENNNGVFQPDGVVGAKGEAAGHAAASSQAAKPFVHIPNLPPGLQQQSFVQLSQGVLQGLRNQEHHLILKLYPKELGEVKVEMMVRDNQVAVSFAMENSRVKEVMESNLEQFKESMGKQGFTLGECTVSLNRDSDGNETWRQFQAASLENAVGPRRTSLADLPDNVFYQRAQPGNGRENGVDLFA